MECCQPNQTLVTADSAQIALVGNPNVGKSVLFHRLTGRYVTVSNYPGTTVELTRGTGTLLPGVTIVDTPGIIAFPARTEDEDVTARVLLDQPLRAIVQVADAKNMRRSLTLSVQLAEMGVPLLIALNMLDEAEARGLQINHRCLSDSLGVPVVPTIATSGKGIKDLAEAVKAAPRADLRLSYPVAVESAVEQIEPLLPAGAPVAARALALQWLSDDPVTAAWLQARLTPANLASLEAIKAAAALSLGGPSAEAIAATRNEWVDDLVDGVLCAGLRRPPSSLATRLGRLAIHPIWGLPVLAVVLYAVYWFVGIFGAGTLVGLLEENLFGEIINPWLTGLVTQISPWPLMTNFIVGEYGIWTVGATYAAALLLPIVTTFFIAFGVLEDSGYLPRLAVLSNRAFTRLGLNGRAVLPMVLGLGCVTMATLTTRILESKRDRLLVMLLLALAVPCSAQLGVVMGMLAGISLGATLIWSGVVLLVLIIVGWLAARLMPGERSPLMVELPPLRWPVLSNVLMKTLVRLEWYIKEAVPLFILGTVILFVLDEIQVLPWLIKAGEPLVSGWLGLPPETSAAFLIGFLRRDFAATGLFAMQAAGELSPLQAVVSIVTITLFIPCIASLMVIAKERGAKVAAGMAGFIFPLAFLVGGLLYRGLLLVGWN